MGHFGGFHAHMRRRRYRRRFCMKRVQIRALNLKPIGRMVKRPFGHKSPNGGINHARGALQGQKDHARQNGWLNPAIAALQSYIQFRRPCENRLDRRGIPRSSIPITSHKCVPPSFRRKISPPRFSTKNTNGRAAPKICGCKSRALGGSRPVSRKLFQCYRNRVKAIW